MTLHRNRPLPSPLIRVGKGSAPVPPVPKKALRPQGAAVKARLAASSGSSSAAAAEGPQQAATAAETTPKEAGAAAKEGEAAASRSEEEAVAGEALVQAGLKLVDAGEALVLAGQALRTTQPIMAQLQPQPQCDNHSHQPQQPALPASAAVSLAPVPKHQLQKPKCGIPLEWGT